MCQQLGRAHGLHGLGLAEGAQLDLHLEQTRLRGARSRSAGRRREGRVHAQPRGLPAARAEQPEAHALAHLGLLAQHKLERLVDASAAARRALTRPGEPDLDARAVGGSRARPGQTQSGLEQRARRARREVQHRRDLLERHLNQPVCPARQPLGRLALRLAELEGGPLADAHAAERRLPGGGAAAAGRRWLAEAVDPAAGDAAELVREREAELVDGTGPGAAGLGGFELPLCHAEWHLGRADARGRRRGRVCAGGERALERRGQHLDPLLLLRGCSDASALALERRGQRLDPLLLLRRCRISACHLRLGHLGERSADL